MDENMRFILRNQKIKNGSIPSSALPHRDDSLRRNGLVLRTGPKTRGDIDVSEFKESVITDRPRKTSTNNFIDYNPPLYPISCQPPDPRVAKQRGLSDFQELVGQKVLPGIREKCNSPSNKQQLPDSMVAPNPPSSEVRMRIDITVCNGGKISSDESRSSSAVGNSSESLSDWNPAPSGNHGNNQEHHHHYADKLCRLTTEEQQNMWQYFADKYDSSPASAPNVKHGGKTSSKKSSTNKKKSHHKRKGSPSKKSGTSQKVSVTSSVTQTTKSSGRSRKR